MGMVGGAVYDGDVMARFLFSILMSWRCVGDMMCAGDENIIHQNVNISMNPIEDISQSKYIHKNQ